MGSPACPILPQHSCPGQGVSLAFHLLHPVLGLSELNDDVRENPKQTELLFPLMRFIISCSDPCKTQKAGLGASPLIPVDASLLSS